MEKTVSFFNNCKKQLVEILKNLKSSVVTFVLVIIVIFITLYYLNNMENIENILALATNVRVQKESKDLTIKDVLKAYPVFNGDNYIVAKETSKEEVEKIEKEEIKISTDTDLFDASAVDAVSNVITIEKPNYTKKSTNYYDRIDIYGITIYDYSSKNIDYEELFKRNVDLTKKSDPVLIYCTHTSETYTNSDNFTFDYTGTYRTKDAKYNMLSVASILNKTLIDRGFNTVFDTTPHDYTSYDNAYKNSMATINKNLDKYSRFGVSIDVHRDAAGDLTFGPETIINGKKVAQLMLVVGVGYDGFPNEYYEQNLALALKIVKLGEEMYPGLFRHVLVRDARYNQQLMAGSLLVEVGATGNTLEEAYYGVRCFANILAKLYK